MERDSKMETRNHLKSRIEAANPLPTPETTAKVMVNKTVESPNLTL
jgi:hypothetical protein